MRMDTLSPPAAKSAQWRKPTARRLWSQLSCALPTLPDPGRSACHFVIDLRCNCFFSRATRVSALCYAIPLDWVEGKNSVLVSGPRAWGVSSGVECIEGIDDGM